MANPRKVTGERIRVARQALGMSQRALAMSCGKPFGEIIGRYEQGKNLPNAEMLVHLADALDVSTDYLLGRVAYMGRW